MVLSLVPRFCVCRRTCRHRGDCPKTSYDPRPSPSSGHPLGVGATSLKSSCTLTRHTWNSNRLGGRISVTKYKKQAFFAPRDRFFAVFAVFTATNYKNRLFFVVRAMIHTFPCTHAQHRLQSAFARTRVGVAERSRSADCSLCCDYMSVYRRLLLDVVDSDDGVGGLEAEALLADERRSLESR